MRHNHDDNMAPTPTSTAVVAVYSIAAISLPVLLLFMVPLYPPQTVVLVPGQAQRIVVVNTHWTADLHVSGEPSSSPTSNHSVPTHPGISCVMDHPGSGSGPRGGGGGLRDPPWACFTKDVWGVAANSTTVVQTFELPPGASLAVRYEWVDQTALKTHQRHAVRLANHADEDGLWDDRTTGHAWWNGTTTTGSVTAATTTVQLMARTQSPSDDWVRVEVQRSVPRLCSAGPVAIRPVPWSWSPGATAELWVAWDPPFDVEPSRWCAASFVARVEPYPRPFFLVCVLVAYALFAVGVFLLGRVCIQRCWKPPAYNPLATSEEEGVDPGTFAISSPEDDDVSTLSATGDPRHPASVPLHTLELTRSRGGSGGAVTGGIARVASTVTMPTPRLEY